MYYALAGLLLGLGFVLELFATYLTVFSRKPLSPAALAVAYAAGLAQIITGLWMGSLQ